MTISEQYTPEFANAVKITLEQEGYFANDEADNGGTTKYGISQRFLDGIKYPKEAQFIDRAEAIELYYAHFWVKCNCENLPSGIALFVFDYAVNSGVTAATKALQKAINFEPELDIKVDGVIGNITIKALERLIKRPSGYAALVQALATIRGNLYLDIIKNNPKQAVFFRGWLRRLWQINEIAQSLNR